MGQSGSEKDRWIHDTPGISRRGGLDTQPDVTDEWGRLIRDDLKVSSLGY